MEIANIHDIEFVNACTKSSIAQPTFHFNRPCNKTDVFINGFKVSSLSSDSYKVVLCSLKLSSLMMGLKVAEHLLATLKRIYDGNMK